MYTTIFTFIFLNFLWNQSDNYYHPYLLYEFQMKFLSQLYIVVKTHD